MEAFMTSMAWKTPEPRQSRVSRTPSGRGGGLRRKDNPQTPRNGAVEHSLYFDAKPKSLLLAVAACTGGTHPWRYTWLAPAGVHLDVEHEPERRRKAQRDAEEQQQYSGAVTASDGEREHEDSLHGYR